jgi:hypothetical protein
MLRFIEETHQYFDGDTELPSVTDIVRFCDYDKIKNARSGGDPFYRERGTKVHELCADYDFTGALPTGTGVDGYLKAYADFKRDYRVNDWLFVEYQLGDAQIGFAGTLDRVGYIEGRLSILDLKTASNVNKVILQAQLTGYLLLLQDDTTFHISADSVKLYGLQLKKNGTYTLHEVEPDYELFNACRTIHRKFWKGANT